jgi:hypothetical protein
MWLLGSVIATLLDCEVSISAWFRMSGWLESWFIIAMSDAGVQSGSSATYVPCATAELPFATVPSLIFRAWNPRQTCISGIIPSADLLLGTKRSFVPSKVGLLSAWGTFSYQPATLCAGGCKGRAVCIFIPAGHRSANCGLLRRQSLQEGVHWGQPVEPHDAHCAMPCSGHPPQLYVMGALSRNITEMEENI